MKVSTYRFTLDLQETASQAMLSMRKGDSARRLLITLSDGGKPYRIADGCYAVVNAKRSDGAYWFGDCVISDSVISCDADGAIATAEGRLDCDVSLFSAVGELLTSPRFSITVFAGVTTSDSEDEGDEYHTLTELVVTAEKNAAALLELKNTIADETAKANEAIQEFNGWYYSTKDEMALLATDTRETCDKLTDDCEAAILKAEQDWEEAKATAEEFAAELREDCEAVIAETEAACSKEIGKLAAAGGATNRSSVRGLDFERLITGRMFI